MPRSNQLNRQKKDVLATNLDGLSQGEKPQIYSNNRRRIPAQALIVMELRSYFPENMEDIRDFWP